MTTYTVDYFIDKFTAIDDELWTTGAFHDVNGCKCALGHCGMDHPHHTSVEALALIALFDDAALSVVGVNDGLSAQYTQDTPKARILAALSDIKKTQADANY
jgi:hypothetical protein